VGTWHLVIARVNESEAATPVMGQDAILARMLSTTNTWKKAGRAEQVTHYHIAKPFTNRYDTGESLRVAMQVVQDTAGKLLHPIALCAACALLGQCIFPEWFCIIACLPFPRSWNL
jgi:hypothetical protein